MFCEVRNEFVCVCIYIYIYIYIYNVYSLPSFNPNSGMSGLYQRQRECHKLGPASRENNIFFKPYK